MKQLITVLILSLSAGMLNAQSNALKFDGNTTASLADKIITEVPSFPDSTARTIEMWIKRGSTSTAQGIMCEMGSTTGFGNRFTVKVQNNHFRVETGGGTNFLEGSTFLSSTSWYHVAAVLDPSAPLNERVKLYLNGNLEASGYMLATTDTIGQPMLHVGVRSNGIGAYNGAIDEFRVWNVARSQAEIQANMNGELCTLPASLFSYFKFNEGVAGGNNTGITTVLDAVNPANVNTLNNFTMTGTTSNFVTGNTNASQDLNVTTVTSCGDYTWAENSTVYSTSGIYDVLYTNIDGCDSIERLDLTIPVIDITVTDNANGTLTANNSSATYQWLNCDTGNSIIGGATSQTYIVSGSGNYAVELTQNGCVDTSVCTNVVVVPSFINPAMHFSGDDDYVQTTYPGILGDNPITVEAWVKTESINNEQVITAWGSDAVNGGRFTFRLAANGADDNIRIEIKGGGITGTVNVNDGNWHHVAVCYDPAAAMNKYKLFVDGVLDTEGDIAQPLNLLANTNMRIGRRLNPGFTGYFSGDMDEVRVWNVAKTEAEIAAGMNNSICQADPNLVSYYSFNEGIPFSDNTAITGLNDYAQYTEDAEPLNFALTGGTSNFSFGPNFDPTLDFTVTEAEDCDDYTWTENSQNYTTSGMYTHLLTNANGCDSVLVLNLTIHQPATQTLTVSACDSYTVNSQTYSATGVYVQNLTSAAGCDSTLTIDLTVTGPSFGTDVISACSAYTWIDAVEYTASNTTAQYTLPGAAVNGCDSIVTLNLTILQPTSATEIVSSCDTYEWALNAQTYSATGMYTTTIQNAAGCDSVVTLDLTILTSPSVSVVDNGDGSLSADLTGMQYQWYNCNMFINIAGEDEINFTPIVNGSYAVIVNDGNCLDTSDCMIVASVGIEENALTNMEVYPNPFNNEVSVNFAQSFNGSISVQTVHGQIIYTEEANEIETKQINLENAPNGVYLLVIENMNKREVIRLVKGS